MLYIYITSIALLIYTYLGYPIIVFLLSKVVKHKINKDDLFCPKVSVIIVVYNGEKYLEKKINNILTCNYPAENIELLIISDGSTDDTNNILHEYSYRIKSKIFKERRGKAACLNDAVNYSTNEYIVFADVRQKFDEDTIINLISPLANETVGAVSGELVFIDDDHNSFSKGIDAYWRYEKFIRNSEAKIHSVIGVTGAVYSIKKSLYKPIPKGVILDDVLIPMQVVLSGYRVLFEATAIAYDVPSNDTVNEKRRKIRTLAGNYQLVSINPSLLNPIKNKLFIQFISHKMLRLLAPFFMLSLFISNIYLFNEGWFYKLTLLSQIFMYTVSILTHYGFREKLGSNILLRMTNTFVILNWYSFLALIEYIKGKKTHLW